MAKSKNRGFNKSQIDHIITRHLAGVSSRKICDELNVPRTRKSSVNNILKLWKDGELVHSGEVADTVLQQEVISEEIALDTLCEHPDWTVSNLAKRLRSAQRTNNQLRKVQRELFDGDTLDVEAFCNFLSDKLSSIDKVVPNKPITSEDCIVEILFSDLQIGKCSEFYNTQNALKAMKYYGEKVMDIVYQNKPSRIVFASLGDIIECAKKHGMQSAYSTDTSNAQQLANATEALWRYVIKPLVETGIPLTIIGVVGNHGADAAKGFDMFKAGLFTYDYVIYKSLELLCQASNAKNVEFILPEGCFAVHNIYGSNYLYEHGYFNKCSEESMIAHKKKRMDNIKEYLHGYRCGDMHHVCLYDCSNLVVSGSFFGIEREGAEYSGILGFNAVPAQVVMVHKPLVGNKLGQSTVVDTKIIQIAEAYI